MNPTHVYEVSVEDYEPVTVRLSKEGLDGKLYVAVSTPDWSIELDYDEAFALTASILAVAETVKAQS